MIKKDEKRGKHTYVEGDENENLVNEMLEGEEKGEIKKGDLFGAFKADPQTLVWL